MNVVGLIVCGLASFRLAELVVVDDGPFDVFMNLRGWASRPPTDTRIRGTLAGILNCVHCAGLWLAIVTGILYATGNDILHLVLFILAIAGLQSILAKHLGRTSS
jgi:hypothetical protein